ncbi:hypothetical protein BC831DRAFT_444364 [Entophlyctis helioformis]|nr:hypothetical protein BC831DRAFT_444364 [Entophlyctis helioformis]
MAGSSSLPRLALGALMLVVAALTTVLIAVTIAKQPISQGFQNILSNAWATSALVDFVTGLSLSIPWMFSLRTSSPPLRYVWLLALVFLGNPILLLRAGVRLLTSPSVHEALFPFTAAATRPRLPTPAASSATTTTTTTTTTTSESSENLVAVSAAGHPSPSSIDDRITPAVQRAYSVNRAILSIVCGGLLVFFVAICVRAALAQPLGEGDAFIWGDPWSLLSLVDTLCGILFTCVYVWCREAPRSASIAGLFVVVLIFTGNALTVCWRCCGAVWLWRCRLFPLFCWLTGCLFASAVHLRDCRAPWQVVHHRGHAVQGIHLWPCQASCRAWLNRPTLWR